MNNTDISPLEKIKNAIYRIYLISKRDILENWRAHSLSLLMLYGIFLLVLVLSVYNYSEAYTPEYQSPMVRHFHEGIYPFLVLTSIGMIYMVATTAFTTKNKGENISTLMLPATTLEKFISCILVRVLGVLAATYLTMNLADATRLLYQPENSEAINQLFIHEKICDFIAEAKDFPSREIDRSKMAFVISILLLHHSFGFVGSALWNKQTKLKATSLVVLVGFIGFRIFYHLFDNGGYLCHTVYANRSSMENLANELLIANRLYIISGITIVLILANYALTYYLFKRRTIKDRKLLWFF